MAGRTSRPIAGKPLGRNSWKADWRGFPGKPRGRGRKPTNRPPSNLELAPEQGSKESEMLNTRSRNLTVVLAAGAMTLFGAAGAFADDGGGGGSGPGGGGGGGGSNPLCSGTPLATT